MYKLYVIYENWQKSGEAKATPAAPLPSYGLCYFKIKEINKVPG